MVNNSECLQLQTRPLVPCRSQQMYGYSAVDLSCPLTQCEAKIVLGDPVLLAKVVGADAVRLVGPEYPVVQGIVFHRICPGATRNANTPLGEVLSNLNL